MRSILKAVKLTFSMIIFNFNFDVLKNESTRLKTCYITFNYYFNFFVKQRPFDVRGDQKFDFLKQFKK